MVFFKRHNVTVKKRQTSGYEPFFTSIYSVTENNN